MSRLLRVELLRFRSRRAIRVVGLGALGLIVIIMVVQFFTHSKEDAGAATERFRAERAASYEQQRSQFERELATGNLPEEARQQPTREEYIEGKDFFGGQSFPESDSYRVASDLDEGVGVVAGIFAFAAFLIGATWAGAEWNAGTMQSLLFWDSRRILVVLAKVAALVVSVVILSVIGQLVLHGLGYVVGVTRGTTEGLTGEWWSDQALVAARGLALSAFTGTVGFAIAFATRNTGFALGAAFLYFAILESLVVAWKGWLMRYSLRGIIAAWQGNGFRYSYGGGATSPPVEAFISRNSGGLTMLVYAAVAVAAAALWFRQRDVT
jgi:ABC-type transport system involved in multi-copper enzyme maturation permease subunit